ncbi:MAG: hypothetical protein JWQ27_2382 [Ferruginibacter sp.]|nr:hypothetical protein [Ferruginibacter sp.]
MLLSTGLFIIFCVGVLFRKTEPLIATTDLYRIDSVRLINKAVKVPRGKGSSAFYYEFDDEAGNTFVIPSNVFEAASSPDLLEDTLQYSAAVLQVYTDKAGIKSYRSNSRESYIHIYQIELNNKPVIDLVLLQDNRIKFKQMIQVISLGIFLVVFVWISQSDRFR